MDAETKFSALDMLPVYSGMPTEKTACVHKIASLISETVPNGQRWLVRSGRINDNALLCRQ